MSLIPQASASVPAGDEESVGAALRRLTGLLTAAGCGEARLDARLLLADLLDVAPMTLFSHPERLLSADQQSRLAERLARRLERQPMAQILGRRDFWSLTFRVTADTLDPRPDSETLIEAALEAFPDRSAPLRIVDLGTGTGCLLLTLLQEYPQARGLGIDASAAALAVAGDNAGRLGLAGRAELQLGNWLDGVSGPFDLVISNPPYIPAADIAGLEPEVSRWEPRSALDGGADGLDCYRAIAAAVPSRLASGGRVLFEVGAGQADAVAALLTAAGLAAQPHRRDLGGIERCVSAIWR